MSSISNWHDGIQLLPSHFPVQNKATVDSWLLHLATHTRLCICGLIY